MTTWTPISEPSTTWQEDAPPLRTFSQFVFSHAYFGGLRVFSLGDGIWDVANQPSTVWVPE